ncbi:hypothetical protein OSCI_2530034 [Kamptonema sp. PCC 6506]|nr:hypothetical protein OSCI_2530034 [Kamptonema sp. PCC 6506]
MYRSGFNRRFIKGITNPDLVLTPGGFQLKLTLMPWGATLQSLNFLRMKQP